METNRQPPDPALRAMHPGSIGGGGVLIAMGLVMMLDRTEMFGGMAWRAFPGLILVMFGLLNFVGTWRACGRGERRNALSGVWLICIGAWLIVNATNAFGLTYRDSWPLLVIAGGLMIVLRELLPASTAVSRKEQH